MGRGKEELERLSVSCAPHRLRRLKRQRGTGGVRGVPGDGGGCLPVSSLLRFPPGPVSPGDTLFHVRASFMFQQLVNYENNSEIFRM